MISSNIILIRHAKKPEESQHEPGIDSNGRDDPYSLSLEGWQQAKQLAELLCPEMEYYHYQIVFLRLRFVLAVAIADDRNRLFCLCLKYCTAQ